MTKSPKSAVCVSWDCLTVSKDSSMTASAEMVKLDSISSESIGWLSWGFCVVRIISSSTSWVSCHCVFVSSTTTSVVIQSSGLMSVSGIDLTGLALDGVTLSSTGISGRLACTVECISLVVTSSLLIVPPITSSCLVMVVVVVVSTSPSSVVVCSVTCLYSSYWRSFIRASSSSSVRTTWGRIGLENSSWSLK